MTLETPLVQAGLQAQLLAPATLQDFPVSGERSIRELVAMARLDIRKLQNTNSLTGQPLRNALE